MHIQQLPRKVVGTYLQALRLPISVAETALRRGRDDAEGWGPALAFDSFGANVKQLVGSVVGDRELSDQGRLQQAKVTELRRAAELRAEAEARKVAADAELRERREDGDARRERVERTAQATEAGLDQQRRQREQRLEAEAARREQAAAEAEAAAKKAVARQERAARATRVAAEREAQLEERRAVEAKGEVVALEGELEASKQARRNGR